MTPDERLEIQRLLDYLQQVTPLLGRVQVTAKQQLHDAQTAATALEGAIGALRAWRRDEKGGQS